MHKMTLQTLPWNYTKCGDSVLSIILVCIDWSCVCMCECVCVCVCVPGNPRGLFGSTVGIVEALLRVECRVHCTIDGSSCPVLHIAHESYDE